jgi:uncharacterized phage protein gp47/JayE
MSSLDFPRYAEIRERIVDYLKEKRGESINTNSDALIGHFIDLQAILNAEINEVLQQVYDGFSIINATDNQLDNLIQLIGLTRSGDAYTTVVLSLTATAPTTIPQGSLYKTEAGVIFQTDSELVFSAAGTQTVGATCTVAGAFEIGIGDVNTIVTMVYAITSVTNTDVGIPGRLRATNEETKLDHTIAVSTSGNYDAASIYEAVNAITGVTSVYIIENPTGGYVDGQPPRSIQVCVIGGNDNSIAEAINNNRVSTVQTFGTEEVEITNETTGITTMIEFTRAANLPCYIGLEITRIPGLFPDDGEQQIKDALVALFETLEIANDVIYTQLYGAIYGIPGIIVTAMTLDIVDPPTGTTNLIVGVTQRATLSADDIAIEVT